MRLIAKANKRKFPKRRGGAPAEALEKERDTLLEQFEAAGEDAEEPPRIEQIADRLNRDGLRSARGGLFA